MASASRVVCAQRILHVAVLYHDAAVGHEPVAYEHRPACLRITGAVAAVEAERLAVFVHLLLVNEVVVAEDRVLIRAAVLDDVLPVVEVKGPFEGVRNEPEGGVKAYQRQPGAGADPGVELIEADPPEHCVQKYRVQFVKVQSPHINRLS